MAGNTRSKQNIITFRSAASMLGVKERVLRYHAENNHFNTNEEGLTTDDIKAIKAQKEQYLSLTDIIKSCDNDRFDSKYVTNRNKYVDYLEENEYFGMRFYQSEEMLFVEPDGDYYFTKEDAEYIIYKSRDFFKSFGLSDKEKVSRLFINSNSRNKALLREYLNNQDDGGNIYTPSTVDFIKLILEIDDITRITDDDVLELLDMTESQSSLENIVRFLTYCKERIKVKYHDMDLKKREYSGIPAYPYEDFVTLAHILFNEQYIEDNKMVEKALDEHFYAEMWLYHAIHYICGWRSADICSRWVYPGFKDSNNVFTVDIKTLRDDLLNRRIQDKTLEDIALYAVRKIEMTYNLPHKTGHAAQGKLRSEIVPELRKFFGTLILIGEYHHVNTGDGYMKPIRAAQYNNWVRCQDFYGDKFTEAFDNNNLSSRRLNKSYLQGLEQASRENGNTALVSHIVAAFARNHANINTTVTYLKDHGLTGESAELVLYMMMQRGIFSVSLYNALIMAYPESFERMSLADQTALMKMIPLSSYDIETAGTSEIAVRTMTEQLSSGKTEEPAVILKAMYEIGQGRGHGKDCGIYCKKKALGEACIHPTYESCIANVCPYHVFTGEGVPSLLEVIKGYNEKYIATGDIKYKAALRKVIIPAFQDIINAVVKNMNPEERAGVRQLITESMNEQ